MCQQSALRSVLMGISFLVAMSSVCRGQATDPSQRSYKLVFSGVDDCVIIPTLRYDGSHPLTIEATVAPFPIDQEPIRAAIIGNVELSGIGISCKPTDWRFNVNDGRDFDLGYAYAHSDQKPARDQPVHLAGVFDGKNLSLFVNGKLQARKGMIKAPHNASVFDFMIGADPDGDGNPDHFFKGTIDEVRISKCVRYKADFALPKENFTPDADTLVLYHFDEGEGQLARDSSANKYHAEIRGTRWVEAPR